MAIRYGQYFLMEKGVFSVALDVSARCTRDVHLYGNLLYPGHRFFYKYTKKLVRGLPAKKVFRRLQIENKLEAISRFELAKKIPLVEL
jgi:hypothetical protein